MSIPRFLPSSIPLGKTGGCNWPEIVPMTGKIAPLQSSLAGTCRRQMDDHSILRPLKTRVDACLFDAVRPFLDGRLGQSDQHNFRQSGRRDINLDRQGVDSQERKGFQLGEHFFNLSKELFLPTSSAIKVIGPQYSAPFRLASSPAIWLPDSSIRRDHHIL